MASSGLHSLATIIKRLEAATSRLEDIAQSGGQPHAPPLPPSSSTVSAEHSSSKTSAQDVPRSVDAFDSTVTTGKLKTFLELSQALGPPIAIQAALVEAQFQALRDFLLMASACSKPSDLTSSLVPLQRATEAITRFKDENRSNRQWFDHLSEVADGSPFVGWVTLDAKPAPFIAEMQASAQFNANRVIVSNKDKDQKQVEWARSYIALLEETRKYVQEFHTTGLVWNAKGIPVSKYKPISVSQASPPAPPPAPAPPPSEFSSKAHPPKATADPSAVFAELNRGSAVTQGLRHVSKSEMTHKNPSLRETVPASNPNTKVGASLPRKPTKPAALSGKKPAKFALEGNKWVVEYQENESALVVEATEINQVVALFGCKNTTVQVKGKVNAVSLLNCTKTSVLVSDIISQISVTSSPSFAIQVTGKAPTIQIDNTDSGQVYLSKECMAGIEILTAKCSAINISIPEAGGEEGMFVERAVPEMLRSVVKDGTLVTSIVEHAA